VVVDIGALGAPQHQDELPDGLFQRRKAAERVQGVVRGNEVRRAQVSVLAEVLSETNPWYLLAFFIGAILTVAGFTLWVARYR